MEDVIVIESSPEGPSRYEKESDDDDDAGNAAASSPGTTATAGGENNDTIMNAEKQQQQQQQQSENNNETAHTGANGNAAEKQPYVKGQPVILGGNISRAAFCLLQGFLEQVPPPASPSDSNKTPTTPINSRPKPVLVPIDRLPAMLGRTHNTSDKNFFGLGKNVKALSRVQCCIEYRIPSGKIGQYSNTSKFTYQPTTASTTTSKTNKKDKSAAAPAAEIILNPTNAPKDETGFYVITCKGKNPIRVNGLKVDQDQTCLLTHGSIIKISAFCLYFLLPSTLSTKTMEITITSKTATAAVSAAKAAADSGGGSSSKRSVKAAAIDSSDSVVPTKKRKTPEMLLSTATAATRAIPKVAASSASLSVGGGAGGAATVKHGGRGAAWKNVQDELDKKTTQELLQQLQEADENGTWDRKCQFVGGTVSYRAVMEAANSPEIQQTVGPDGVSKAQIVEWINTSHQFGAWAQLMQSKLEPKSYQSSIANAMRKAGFERSGSINFGRHVKWLLPPEFQKSGSGSSSGGGGNMVSQSQPQGGESDDDSDNNSMANGNNDESDGGDDDDDDEVHDDDDNDDKDQDAAGSGRPDEESVNDSDSENDGA